VKREARRNEQDEGTEERPFSTRWMSLKGPRFLFNARLFEHHMKYL